jgi:hypothetical protein
MSSGCMDLSRLRSQRPGCELARAMECYKASRIGRGAWWLTALTCAKYGR